MGPQVKITLTTLDDNIVPARRELILNAEARTIIIGRASKNSSKSFQSSGDNAWFDSPVMSRDHAEIYLDTENESLILQDIGSMHGTCVNNTRLDSHAPIKLQNGDIIVFGTEVMRGLETFSPCKFIFNHELSSHKAANTFVSSDSSDVDEKDVSLDESTLAKDQIGTTYNRRPLTPEAVLEEIPQLEPAIDLISIGSPISSTDEIEGMVSENTNLTIQKTIEIPQDDEKIPGNVGIGVDKSKDFVVCLQDEKERQASHGPDSQSPKETGAVISTSQKGLHRFDYRFADGIPLESSALTPDVQNKDPCITHVDDKYNHIDDTTKTDNSPDSKSLIQCEYGLPPTTEEVTKSFFVDELTSQYENSSKSSDYDYLPCDQYVISGDYNSTKESTQRVKQKVSPSLMNNLPNPAASQDYCQLSMFEGGRYLFNELSSFHSAKLKQEKSVKIGACRTGKSNEPWDQILGDKTGKSAYFSARKFNKAKFDAMGYYYVNDMRGSYLPIGNLTRRSDSLIPENLKDYGEINSLSFHSVLCQKNTHKESPIWNDHFSTDKYLHKKMMNNLILSSDENVSVVCKSNKIVAPKKSHKSRFAHRKCYITRVDNGKSRRYNKSMKRKADEISGAYCGDIGTCPSFKCDARPTKRLRYLESFGYIALGGFAAVTFLFSILVATAPDFA